MICPKCNHEFKSPGQVAGGKASRRTLTKEQAIAMVKKRKKNPVKVK